jgi:hypothetical protein
MHNPEQRLLCCRLYDIKSENQQPYSIMLRSFKKPFLPLITAMGRRIERRRFSDPPIYIGGCGRSGTTLLLSILSAHEKIFACRRELGIFNDAATDEHGRVYPGRIDRLYRTFLSSDIPATATRWCEKSPSNIYHVDEIETYHAGDFKFIQIVRDGRDVVLSKHPTNPDEYWVSPQRWIDDVGFGKQYLDHPKVHTILYHDLIEQYEETIGGICKFLEIEMTPSIAQCHQHAKVKRNNAYFGKVKALSNKSIGKWKKDENRARARELTDIPEAMELLRFYDFD